MAKPIIPIVVCTTLRSAHYYHHWGDGTDHGDGNMTGDGHGDGRTGRENDQEIYSDLSSVGDMTTDTIDVPLVWSWK